MWWTITFTLLLLWGFGLGSSYTIGGFNHILLILAFIVMLLNLIQSRKPM